MIPMRQRDPLNRIPQHHFPRRAPSALEARRLTCANSHIRWIVNLALRLPAADLVVDAVPPDASLFWRNPSTLRKSLLKKLTSRLRRPNSPSRLATWASSSRILLACGSSSAAGWPCGPAEPHRDTTASPHLFASTDTAPPPAHHQTEDTVSNGRLCPGQTGRILPPVGRLGLCGYFGVES